MSTDPQESRAKTFGIQTYRVTEDRLYVPQFSPSEVEELLIAYEERIPVALIGPTGCGKTTLVEKLAYMIGQMHPENPYAGTITTILGQEDMTATELRGEPILGPGGTTNFQEGPLTIRVKYGGIFYLDELPEARPGTLTSVHSVTDYRRTLTIPELKLVFEAPDDFMFMTSWNPGHQQRRMKISTRDRFYPIKLRYHPPEVEAGIISHYGKVDEDTALLIARVGAHVRGGTPDGKPYLGQRELGTRRLIDAAKFIRRGRPVRLTLQRLSASVDASSTEDQQALDEAIDTLLSDMGLEESDGGR